MSRRILLLAALGAVLLVVLAWLLLLQPQQDEITDIRAETERLQQQEQQLALRLAALQRIREEAPEAEAELAAAAAIIPRETALPALLRQLQSAADDSGLLLSSVSTNRPAPVGDTGDLATIGMTVDIEGGYFQIVDFLRRLEDPAISPRGIRWSGLSVSGVAADHPTLTASLQGAVFALLPASGTALQAPPPEPDPEPEADADVEVDVTIEEEAG